MSTEPSLTINESSFMPPCAKDNFPDLFGGQSSGDFGDPKNGNQPVLTEADQAHLRTFGVLPGNELQAFDTIQEIKQAGWEIWGPAVEQGIAHFLEAVRAKRPNFAIPNNASVRKDWYKDVAGHLQDYKIEDLAGLYKRSIDKLDHAGMSCSRPGSLTKTLPEVANEPALSTAPTLTEAEKLRLAELTAQFSPTK